MNTEGPDMARPRSQKVFELKEKLIQRLENSRLTPGDRFLSSRAVALKFGVSYQTAYRLLNELVTEGRLLRRQASGTYIPGIEPSIEAIQLVFSVRARRKNSYGAALLKRMGEKFNSKGIPFFIAWEDNATIRPDAFPIFWECPKSLERFCGEQRYGLLLDDAIPPQLDASFIDSISIDNFAGGAAAGRYLVTRTNPNSTVIVFSGPENDLRNTLRVAGFRAIMPSAQIISANTWFGELVGKTAGRIAASRPDAVFCCNDHLAETVINAYTQMERPFPTIVGFDDAPVAEALNLSTVAIPWERFITLAVNFAIKRMAGDRNPTMRQLMVPQFIVRNT